MASLELDPIIRAVIQLTDSHGPHQGSAKAALVWESAALFCSEPLNENYLMSAIEGLAGRGGACPPSHCKGRMQRPFVHCRPDRQPLLFSTPPIKIRPQVCPSPA